MTFFSGLLLWRYLSIKKRRYRVPASIFCFGTLASAPYCRAVDGSNCIRPIEPRDETASHRKFDSVATMLFTRAVGTPCFLDAAAINACTSSSLRAARFSAAMTRCTAWLARAAGIGDRLDRAE